MASGDLIMSFAPNEAVFPLSNPAQLGFRNNHTHLAYDAGTAETAYFEEVWPAQFPAANGCTVRVHGRFATATSSSATVQVAFERIGTALDVDSDSFASAKNITVTANATAGIHSTGTSAFTQAEMDSLADNEEFRIRSVRATGGATGDFELTRLAILVT